MLSIFHAMRRCVENKRVISGPWLAILWARRLLRNFSDPTFLKDFPDLKLIPPPYSASRSPGSLLNSRTSSACSITTAGSF